MGAVLSYLLAEEEPLEIAVKQFASRTRLLLRDISAETDIDYLDLHIDSVAELSASGIDYEIVSKPGNLYLLVFKSSIGLQQLDNIKTKLLQTKFNEGYIQVEEVPPSKSVIISNIDKIKRTKEYLGLYFSNPNKCGVSGFDHFDLLENGQVIVYFEDSQCVQDLLQTSHNKLGQNVELHVYDRFTILKENITSEICISKEVPHTKALFTKKCESFRKLLGKMHANVEFDTDDASENASIHIKSIKGHEEVKSWREKCEVELEQFLKGIYIHSLSIKPELLPALQHIVEEKNSDPSLHMEFTENQTTLHIVGYCEDVTKFLEMLQQIESTELVKDECITLKPEKLSYINQVCIDNLREDHPNVNFTTIDDCTIHVTGKKLDIDKFKDSMGKIKIACTLVSASQEVLDFLSLSDDQTTIYRLLQNQKEHIHYAVYCDQRSHKFYIVTGEQSTANKLARYVKQVIHRIVLKINGNTFDTQHFTELCEQLKKQYIVDFSISFSEIEILGDRQDVEKVSHQIKSRIHSKYFKTKEMKISNGHWRFISEQLTEQWSKILGKIKTDPQYNDVQITYPETVDSNPVIKLKGEESLIAILFGEISTLIESIYTSDPPLKIGHDHPGILEYLNTKEVKFMIQGIERDVHTCIEVITEPDQPDTVKQICTGVTKEGKRIILVEGNIETFRVDVIVNAANKHLQHGGGVAKALSEKGGPKFQRDSNIYVKLCGALSDGDAIIRDEVGNLPCKKIIHAVGPMWKNDGKVEKILMKACIKSLELGCGFESIAFPAICSGIYKFPVNVSANTMIQAFCTWSENFPETPLCSIYIVVHNHAVSAFSDAIKAFLNTSSNEMLLPVQAPTEMEVNISDNPPSNVPLGEIPDALLNKTEDISYHNNSLTRTDLGAKTTEPIKLYKGELLSQQAEIYVNSTASTLVLSNGTVSKHLLARGGEMLQHECYRYVSDKGNVRAGDIAVTGPGKIPCKYIIHTVGAEYDFSDGSKSAKMLKEIVIKCLKVCESKKASTIAFPALGAGALKYPPQVVAEVMITTVQNYYQTNSRTTCIKEVKFLIYLNDIYKEFECILPHCSKTSVMPPIMDSSASRRDITPVFASDHSRSTPLSTTEPTSVGNSTKAPIKICKGKLLKEKAEIYVNSTSDNLALSNGEVSKCILKKGGPAVQKECHQHVSNNGKVQVGDIAVTGPGKISCKFIIHAVGTNFDASNVSKSEQILQAIVQKCLEECNKRTATTIAFPALCAGILGYPSEVVAKVMITTVQNYYQINATTCIKQVKFVLFKDTDYKNFESFLHHSVHTPTNLPSISSPHNVQSSLLMSTLQHPPSMSPPKVKHNILSMSSLRRPPPPQSLPQKIHRPSSVSPHSLSLMDQSTTSLHSVTSSRIFKTGDIKLEIVCGDITKDTSDVIVNTTQSDLQLATGTVSKTISQIAGPDMQQTCSMYIKEHKQLEEGKICITKATGQLRCKMVFHIVAPNNKKASALGQIISTCLYEADHNKLNSIAFPAIGTGGLSYNPTVAAQGICEAIIEFGQTNPVHLKQVRIVVFQEDMLQAFVQKCIKLSTEQAVPPKPSFLTQCISAMPFKSVASKFSHKINPVMLVPQTPTVQIRVYAKSQEVVKEAEESLLSIIGQQFEPISFDNLYISNLQPEQLLQLRQEAAKLNLVIEVKKETSQIKIRGRKDNVQQLKDIINTMLHEIEKTAMKIKASEREEQLKRDASEAKIFIQTKVKWQFLSSGNQYENYNPDLNYQMEQAYQLQKTHFTYTNNNLQQCTVYFNRNPMQEENNATRDVVNLQRIDIEKAEFPSTWQFNNNETEVVKLTEDSPEYVDVKNGFASTASGKKILKIERIQNPNLYAVYLARKKRMDIENSSDTKNEQKLYHGCPGDVAVKIIHQGFNRSYAGRNQTALGEGVYFAVMAEYSAQDRYSEQDAKGNKHMFLVRVLSGEYTKGRRGMKAPPAKDPSKNEAILFDSVVDNPENPTIFVVFHDAHCYPEYLITFKT